MSFWKIILHFLCKITTIQNLTPSSRIAIRLNSKIFQHKSLPSTFQWNWLVYEIIFSPTPCEFVRKSAKNSAEHKFRIHLPFYENSQGHFFTLQVKQMHFYSSHYLRFWYKYSIPQSYKQFSSQQNLKIPSKLCTAT